MHTLFEFFDLSSIFTMSICYIRTGAMGRVEFSKHCPSDGKFAWLERALKRLDIVSVSGELGCMCVDNFCERVAVAALVVVDRSVRADGRLAGVMH